MPSSDFLILHPDDNVAVATRSLPKGAVAFAEREIRLAEPVRMGHKMALAEIAPGRPVIKYGQIIGFASQPIAPANGYTRTMSMPGRFLAITPRPPQCRLNRSRSPG